MLTWSAEKLQVLERVTTCAQGCHMTSTDLPNIWGLASGDSAGEASADLCKCMSGYQIIQPHALLLYPVVIVTDGPLAQACSWCAHQVARRWSSYHVHVHMLYGLSCSSVVINAGPCKCTVAAHAVQDTRLHHARATS